MIVFSVPVTYHSLIIDRALVATAARDELLGAFRQIFDELGLRVHKQNSSLLVHWPRGLGSATKVAAVLTIRHNHIIALLWNPSARQVSRRFTLQLILSTVA